MFSINTQTKQKVTKDVVLESPAGDITVKEGDEVVLLDLMDLESNRYFAIRTSGSSLLILPGGLFNNNFNQFKQEV